MKQDDRIEKLTGGNYLRDNDFHMDDLSEEEQEELMNTKPGLFPMLKLWKRFGDVEKIGNFNFAELIAEELGQNGTVEHDGVEYFLLEEDMDLEDLASKFNLPELESYRGKIAGDEHFDWCSDINWTDHYESECEELFSKWLSDNPDGAIKLKHYFESKYGEIIEDDELDVDNVEDLITLIKDNHDEIGSLFSRAVETGERYGAEAELSQNYENLINDFFKSGDLEIKRDADDYHKYNIVFTKETFFSSINVAEVDYDNYVFEVGMSSFEAFEQLIEDESIEANDLSVPYYGFSGFDESGFKEDFDQVLTEHVHDLPDVPIALVTAPFGKSEDIPIPASIIQKQQEDQMGVSFY